MAVQILKAQSSSKPDTSVRESSRLSLTITAGYMAPKSKDALTQFWKGGPGLALRLLVQATPAFSVGAGADLSILWFRQSSFVLAHPSVEVRRKDMAWVNLFVLSRFSSVTPEPVCPYAELAIGASRPSGAEYKAVVDGVRVTYYEIPARTRLALTFAGGLEIPVSGRISFLAEAAMRYVHNDPNIGVALLFSGGVRVKL